MTRSPVDASSSDEELACQAQRGCVSSLDRLLRRFQGPLLQFLRHQGAGADAEDLLQETFLRAYENLHRYNNNWPFSSWLFTIARRVGINHHRGARLKMDDCPMNSVASTVPEPWRTVASTEDRVRLWDVAACVLSEEQTTALWLHYVEEMPIQEIARVLERTRSSVKVLLFRARKRLLPILHEMNESHEDFRNEIPLRHRRSSIVPMEVRHG
jgi:RNA polymerase sigma-70 factor, ECF subfamily